MMLLITNSCPRKAVEWLIKNTNKRYVWKQLLEVSQIVCSAGISNVFKEIKQGVKLREWVLKHKEWTYWYMMFLYDYCIHNLDIKFETIYKIKTIIRDLHNKAKDVYFFYVPKTAIFRYAKGYECEYATNSELDIDLCCKLYRDYIKNYKFKKSEV